MGSEREKTKALKGSADQQEIQGHAATNSLEIRGQKPSYDGRAVTREVPRRMIRDPLRRMRSLAA